MRRADVRCGPAGRTAGPRPFTAAVRVEQGARRQGAVLLRISCTAGACLRSGRRSARGPSSTAPVVPAPHELPPRILPAPPGAPPPRHRGRLGSGPCARVGTPMRRRRCRQCAPAASPPGQQRGRLHRRLCRGDPRRCLVDHQRAGPLDIRRLARGGGDRRHRRHPVRVRYAHPQLGPGSPLGRHRPPGQGDPPLRPAVYRHPPRRRRCRQPGERRSAPDPHRPARQRESGAVAGGLWRVASSATNRARPTSGEGRAHWSGPGFTHDHSFPSGEGTAAYSCATIIAEEWHDLPGAAPLSYGVATLVALERLNDNAHWASDLFAAGVLGCGVSLAVERLHPMTAVHLGTISVVPILTRREQLLSCTWTF